MPQSQVSTLVDICRSRLSEYLALSDATSLDHRLGDIPEAELANLVWWGITTHLRLPSGTQRACERRHALLAALGKAFWRLPMLRLRLGCCRQLCRAIDSMSPHAQAGCGCGDRSRWLPGLAPSLWLLSSSLAHLELGVSSTTDLDWVAGLPLLTCLCLRGCSWLPAGALWRLRACPRLAALDLRGLSMLGDDAGAPLAALGGLRALHLGSTGAGDGLVEALMFRLRLEAWCRKSGGALTDEQRSWPECRIEELVLEGTRLTAASLPLLQHLSGLRFLDLRCAAPSLYPHQVQHARCWQCVTCKSSSMLDVEVVTLGRFITERAHDACRSPYTED